MSSRDWKAWTPALLLCAVPLALPLYNPDLFWHLSAGRWIAEHKTWPRADSFSFTRAGAPWSDFEWLSQTIYYGVYCLDGMRGLWLLKVFLLGASLWLMRRLFTLYGLPAAPAAAGLALWSAGLLHQADLRPEVFSVLGFQAALFFLERRRLGRSHSALQLCAGAFLLFALWANVHPGFTFGLLLILCCAAAERSAALAPAAAAAFLGTLCNPYGTGLYAVMAEHWSYRSVASAFIQEFKPMPLNNSYQWPFWVILILLIKQAGRRLPAGPALAAMILGAAAFQHMRLAVYFNALAVPIVMFLAAGAGKSFPRKAVLAGFLAYALVLGVFVLPGISWKGFFDEKWVCADLAGFLARERGVVEGLRVYNPPMWGGYLGWTLRPWHKVSRDGRYLFLPDFPEAADAYNNGASSWQEYLYGKGADAAILDNWPGASDRMPVGRWALVYRDARALFFVDRRRVPAEWLASQEARAYRPRF